MKDNVDLWWLLKKLYRRKQKKLFLQKSNDFAFRHCFVITLGHHRQLLVFFVFRPKSLKFYLFSSHEESRPRSLLRSATSCLDQTQNSIFTSQIIEVDWSSGKVSASPNQRLQKICLRQRHDCYILSCNIDQNLAVFQIHPFVSLLPSKSTCERLCCLC